MMAVAASPTTMPGAGMKKVRSMIAKATVMGQM